MVEALCYRLIIFGVPTDVSANMFYNKNPCTRLPSLWSMYSGRSVISLTKVGAGRQWLIITPGIPIR